jgi:hypothetical protein
MSGDENLEPVHMTTKTLLIIQSLIGDFQGENADIAKEVRHVYNFVLVLQTNDVLVSVRVICSSCSGVLDAQQCEVLCNPLHGVREVFE